MAAVDDLILCLPSTPETTGVLDAARLAALGAGMVVNVGRGDLVDEDALFAALESGRLAGAGIDTWPRESEPVAQDGGRWPYARPFHTLSNVVLSPHRAASPFTDLDRWDDVLANLRTALAGGDAFVNRVDLGLGY